MLFYLLVAWCLYATVYARLHGRDDGCQSSYTKCQPKGASATTAPEIDDSLSGLYVDLLDSINKVQNTKRDIAQRGNVEIRSSDASVCCADGTKCLVLQDKNLPFCYDQFTTNYFLPGGATGQVASGDYSSSEGEANLLNGTYSRSDGKSGTIVKPDTATLTLPTQYTASGVGSAIPVTALGQETTYTTTIPGTTIPASTISAHVVSPTVVSGTSEPAITEKATTIPASTVDPKTSTITTQAAKASSTSKSDGGSVSGRNVVLSGASGLLSVLVFVGLL